MNKTEEIKRYGLNNLYDFYRYNNLCKDCNRLPENCECENKKGWK